MIKKLTKQYEYITNEPDCGIMPHEEAIYDKKTDIFYPRIVDCDLGSGFSDDPFALFDNFINGVYLGLKYKHDSIDFSELYEITYTIKKIN